MCAGEHQSAKDEKREKVRPAIPKSRGNHNLAEADGSDLDISESLPNDNSASQSPNDAATTTANRHKFAPPQVTQSPTQQPVYAVVKKKKTQQDKFTAPSAVAALPTTEPVKEISIHNKAAPVVKVPRGTMSDKRSTQSANIDIPVIKISKMESIEKADIQPERQDIPPKVIISFKRLARLP